MENTKTLHSKHLGRKIGRMRELLGIKQDLIAVELGISQQKVSKIEQSENVDDDTLKKIANVLGVRPEAIKNFSEEAAMNFIQNNYEGSSNIAQVNEQNNNYKLDDTLSNIIEENKKLYEALLKEKDEKIALLQKLLDNK